MRIVRYSALVFLFFAFSFFLGFAFTKKNIPPIPQILDTYFYVFKYNPADDTTPKDRILNDTGRYPYRLLRPSDPSLLEARDFRDIDLPESAWRTRDAQIFVDTTRREPKLTLVNGLLGPDETAHAVLLIDPEGNLLHQWPITQGFVEWPHNPDFNMLLHGFEVFPDGSLIVALNKGNTLARFDTCGQPIWYRKFGIHHSIESDGHEHLWTWDGENDAVRVRIADGEVVQRISLEQILEANDDTDALGILQRDFLTGSTWLHDPFHANDVEALQPEMAAAFPEFGAGDLLFSLRSLNLMMIVDPVTARIKWWRIGASRRQHDPDWLPDGSILYYDNNTNRGASRIRKINPATLEVTDVVKGEDYNFYSSQMGTQHWDDQDGSVLISSADQGRVFEVTPSGDVVFELINLYDTDHVGYVGDAMTVPMDFFEEMPTCE